MSKTPARVPAATAALTARTGVVASPAVGQGNVRELPGVVVQRRHRRFLDAYPRAGHLRSLLGRERGRATGEDDELGSPLAQQPGVFQGRVAVEPRAGGLRERINRHFR